MRRRVSFDVWICLCIAVGVAWLAGLLYTNIIAPIQYDAYLESKQLGEEEVGNFATEHTLIAQNSEDIRNNETFTLFLEGGDSYDIVNAPLGYTSFGLVRLYTLPSGETVMVNPNLSYAVESEEGLMMPIGTFVSCDFPKEEAAGYQQLLAISGEAPSVVDGYIDMLGNSYVETQENYSQNITMIVQAVVFVILFILLRRLGSKLGFFNSIFGVSLTKKEKEEQIKRENQSDWD